MNEIKTGETGRNTTANTTEHERQELKNTMSNGCTRTEREDATIDAQGMKVKDLCEGERAGVWVIWKPLPVGR